jgi:hypothetical protein
MKCCVASGFAIHLHFAALLLVGINPMIQLFHELSPVIVLAPFAFLIFITGWQMGREGAQRKKRKEEEKRYQQLIDKINQEYRDRIREEERNQPK